MPAGPGEAGEPPDVPARGVAHASPIEKVGGIIRAIWIPVLLFAGYSLAFLNATFRLRADEYIYPRFLISLILLLVVWQVIVNVTAVLKANAWLTASQLRDWWTNWQRSVYTMLMFALFLFLIPRLGFYIAAAIFGFAIMMILRLGRIFLAALTTAMILAFSYGLFTRFLGLRLPTF